MSLEPEHVRQLILEVNAQYAAQLTQERRAAAPDEDHLALLRERMQACSADLQLLDDADKQELAGIQARYTALRNKAASQETPPPV